MGKQANQPALTSGPWSVKVDEKKRFNMFTGAPEIDATYYIDDSEGKNIGLASCYHKDVLANARLMAAAPDLLECLKGFTRNVRQLNDEHFSGLQEKLVAMANEAIAKAEGAL